MLRKFFSEPGKLVRTGLSGDCFGIFWGDNLRGVTVQCVLCSRSLLKRDGARIKLKPPVGVRLRFQIATVCEKCFADLVEGRLNKDERVLITDAIVQTVNVARS